MPMVRGSEKLDLVRAAARRGPAVAARQLSLVLADTFLRQKHLVFHAPAQRLLAGAAPAADGFGFREMSAAEALATLPQRLDAPGHRAVDWGRPDWFAHGWRLWVAERQGELAALAWWRGAAQARDYLPALRADEELLWHCTVLPAFRGCNLQAQAWQALARARTAAGITGFYTNCRDYNLPSRRNIARVGFTCIGFVRIDRLSGRRRVALADRSSGHG